MLARLPEQVIQENPYHVLWQLDTNAVLRDRPLDPSARSGAFIEVYVREILRLIKWPVVDRANVSNGYLDLSMPHDRHECAGMVR